MSLQALALQALAYYSGVASPRAERRVEEACAECALKLGHALGPPWQRCVIELLQGYEDDEFSLSDFSYSPLTALPGAGRANGELLKNLMRNFTCDFEDGGSQPLRTMTWQYQERDPCAGASATEQARSFTYKAGYLPAGDELTELNGLMSEAEAEAACLASPVCRGFTYNSGEGGRPPPDAMRAVYFKSAIGEVGLSDQWHTLKRRGGPGSKPLDCRRGKRAPPPLPSRLRVDVLRDAPPVYLVHDFASDEECEYMVNLTLPRMTPSVVFSGSKGATSTYRSSYSVNMVPDFEDETDVVTRLMRRKFAFAREVAEYDELVENEGQEPVNAVYYKDDGDQYRPHCDGECHGGGYRRGRRIATSLTYCLVGDKGGYTSFDRAGLKVVPKRRMMLFFGYKINGDPPAMDNGQTEHSGCPLREGRKWIATMWYREGMTPERGWQQHQH
mmetsp:Transcript_2712/g.8917  ORF Transcript_2712/g.8917 Transcript_2712/m.8917 type:complete len:445 (-) Transcript_2712:126-1460(-)